MNRSIITLFISILLVGCGSSTDEAKKVTVKDSKASTEKASKANTEVAQNSQTMLFFLNPNGGPCIQQGEILKKMESQLKDKKVTLQYVSTLNIDADGPIFQKYGIRMLPTIIVLDKDGKEKKRFPAGIQSEAALLQAIN